MYYHLKEANGMLLAIDMGNTCITLGVFDQNRLVAVGRLSADHKRTEDQYAIEFRDLLDINNLKSADFDGAILCSVVPVLTNIIEKAIRKILRLTPLTVGPGVKTGLNIKLDNPAQLGSDLVAGAVAAIEKYPLPCIIFDLGTANTISVINSKGDFLGGIITAGIGISLDALVSRTSQLPYVSLENTDRLIGTNTIASMKSGLVFGTAAMIDGLAMRIEEELGQKATLVATGGRAGEIVSHCKREIKIREYLLLEGLKIIYGRNA